MIRLSLLYPVVDEAARLGEDVVRARAAQRSFERRPVEKSAFAVVPIGDLGGGGRGGRGLSLLPGLGQALSVRGHATLVRHQETLSLSYLRRSFLRIGRGAWGRVRAVAHGVTMVNLVDNLTRFPR